MPSGCELNICAQAGTLGHLFSRNRLQPGDGARPVNLCKGWRWHESPGRGKTRPHFSWVLTLR